MRKLSIFLTSILLIAVLALIITSSGLLPYLFPVTSNKMSQVTIPFTSKKSEVEELNIPATTSLVVHSQHGHVVVQRGESDTFQITLEKQSQSPNPLRAQQLVEQISFTVESQEEVTILKVEVPETSSGEQVSADLLILIPNNLNLNVQAGLGNVEITDVEGNIQIYCNLGAIKLRRFQGNAALESSLGNIWVSESIFAKELVAITNLGDLHIQGSLGETNVLESKLGNLELLLSPHQSYVLEGRLTLGKFTTQVPFTGQQTKQHVQGIIGSGEQKGHLLVNLNLGSLHLKNQNDEGGSL